MSQIKIEVSKNQRRALESPSFLEKLKESGFYLDFRVDKFESKESSEFIFYGFNAEKITEDSLDRLESKIEKELESKRNEIIDIEYPIFIGALPYKIYEKANTSVITCFKSKIVLCIHKALDYGILIDAPVEFEIALKEGDQHEKNTKYDYFQDQIDSEKGAEYNLKFSYDEYEKKFNKAIKEISEGEIFQVVLSEEFELPYTRSPYLYYQHSLEVNKPAYACFLNIEEGLCVTSPEMLVSYDGDWVKTKPIAGTRGLKHDSKDLMRIEELIHNEKEGSEHLMLVDLGRNDLSKVCLPGTVEVVSYKKPLILEHLVHLVSEVRGRKSFSKIFDPIRATFPAGTVSGAPKVRAMEIIDEIEESNRGLYAGAIFRITNNGNFESCISIRCLEFKGGKMHFRAGSGIVFDGNANDEYKEIMNKAIGNVKTYERMEGKYVSFIR